MQLMDVHQNISKRPSPPRVGLAQARGMGSAFGWNLIPLARHSGGFWTPSTPPAVTCQCFLFTGLRRATFACAATWAKAMAMDFHTSGHGLPMLFSTRLRSCRLRLSLACLNLLLIVGELARLTVLKRYPFVTASCKIVNTEKCIGLLLFNVCESQAKKR